MSKYKWYVFVIGILMFSLMAFLVTNGMTNVIDSNVYNVITIYTFDIETSFFKFITFFASEYGIVLMLIILFFAVKDKKHFVLILLSAVLTVLLNYVLKSIFMRERPFDLMIVSEWGYSFPSGHAMISIGFYGYLLYLLRRCDFSFKNYLMVMICILIFLIGISRIYLGVHYPTDVIAGYSIASSFLILYIEFTRRFLDDK